MSKKKINLHTPELPGSTDADRKVNLQFFLPKQFQLLCNLVDVSPHQLLTDFMDDLSQGSWKNEGRNEPREILKTYFLAHHYGHQYYSKDDIKLIFEELTAIGMLFPKNAPGAFLDIHNLWRSEYHRYWFEKWKKKRKPLTSLQQD